MNNELNVTTRPYLLMNEIERLTINLHKAEERAMDLASTLGALHVEQRILTTALTDIVTCNIPDVPAGVTVSMNQFGPFARERAEQALKDIGFYK